MTKNKNFQFNFNIQEAQLNDCFQLSNLHLYCLPFDPGSVLGFTFLSKTLYPHMIEHTICTLVAKNLHGDLIGFIGVGKPLSWVQIVHFNTIIKFLVSPNLWFALIASYLLNFLRISKSKDLEILWLFIHPDFQGKGLGAQLGHEAIKNVEALGYSKIWVRTLESTPRNIRFYEALGFTQIATCLNRQLLLLNLC